MLDIITVISLLILGFISIFGGCVFCSISEYVYGILLIISGILIIALAIRSLMYFK